MIRVTTDKGIHTGRTFAAVIRRVFGKDACYFGAGDGTGVVRERAHYAAPVVGEVRDVRHADDATHFTGRVVSIAWESGRPVEVELWSDHAGRRGFTVARGSTLRYHLGKGNLAPGSGSTVTFGLTRMGNLSSVVRYVSFGKRG